MAADHPARATLVLQGEFRLRVGNEVVRSGLLPRIEEAGLGRGPNCAIRIPKSWVPRDLGSFGAVAEGWVFRNGPGMPVVVTGDWIRQGRFQPGAFIMLQEGSSQLTWPLDERFVLELDVRRVPRPRIDLRKVVHPGRVRDPLAGMRTAHLGDDVVLNAVERYQLAHLFAHLINDEHAPSNLAEAAASRLGSVRASEVKQRAHRVRKRINSHRKVPLTTLHELGEYLVAVTGALTASDLRDPSGYDL